MYKECQIGGRCWHLQKPVEADGSQWNTYNCWILVKFCFEVNTYNETVKIPSHSELSK